MPGVDQQQLEAVLQDRPHRLPVHAGGLHRHLRDAMRLQPIVQHKQASNRGPELADLLLPRPIRRRDAHTRRHLLLVHIERRGALHDHIHPEPPEVDQQSPSTRGLGNRRVCRACSRQQSRDPGEAPTPNYRRAHRHHREHGVRRTTPTNSPRNAPAPAPIFTRRGSPPRRGQLSRSQTQTKTPSVVRSFVSLQTSSATHMPNFSDAPMPKRSDAQQPRPRPSHPDSHKPTGINRQAADRTLRPTLGNREPARRTNPRLPPRLTLLPSPARGRLRRRAHDPRRHRLPPFRARRAPRLPQPDPRHDPQPPDRQHRRAALHPRPRRSPPLVCV